MSGMDFHFYSSPEPTRQKLHFMKIFVTFLPLFVVAALLPVLLGLVRNPVTTRSSAQAEQNDLTVWIEPANVVVTHGTPVTLTVKAMYDGGGKLLPGVIVPVHVDGLVAIQGSSVEYKIPFTGQLTLGTVIVTPEKAGTYSVYITPEEIVSPNSINKPNSVVSAATLTVR